MKKMLLLLAICMNATIAFSYDYCSEVTSELEQVSERYVGGPSFYQLLATSRVHDCECTDLENECSFKVHVSNTAHAEGGVPNRPLYFLEMRKNIINRNMHRRARRYLRRAKSKCSSMGLNIETISNGIICSAKGVE